METKGVIRTHNNWIVYGLSFGLIIFLFNKSKLSFMGFDINEYIAIAAVGIIAFVFKTVKEDLLKFQNENTLLNDKLTKRVPAKPRQGDVPFNYIEGGERGGY